MKRKVIALLATAAAAAAVVFGGGTATAQENQPEPTRQVVVQPGDGAGTDSICWDWCR